MAKAGTILAAALAALLFVDWLFYCASIWQRHNGGPSGVAFQIWLLLSGLFTAYIGAIIGALGAITDEPGVKFGSIIFCAANIFLLGFADTTRTLSGSLLLALGWSS